MYVLEQLNEFKCQTKVRPTCITSVEDKSYKQLQYMCENLLAY